MVEESGRRAFGDLSSIPGILASKIPVILAVSSRGHLSHRISSKSSTRCGSIRVLNALRTRLAATSVVQLRSDHAFWLSLVEEGPGMISTSPAATSPDELDLVVRHRDLVERVRAADH